MVDARAGNFFLGQVDDGPQRGQTSINSESFNAVNSINYKETFSGLTIM